MHLENSYSSLINLDLVILDPYYFGSGNSFHESMYYGTSTVTKPTNYSKSRVVENELFIDSNGLLENKANLTGSRMKKQVGKISNSRRDLLKKASAMATIAVAGTVVGNAQALLDQNHPAAHLVEFSHRARGQYTLENEKTLV